MEYLEQNKNQRTTKDILRIGVKTVFLLLIVAAYVYSLTRWGDYYAGSHTIIKLVAVTVMYALSFVAVFWRNGFSDRVNLVCSGLLFCLTPFLCYLLVECANSEWSALFVEGKGMSLKLHLLNGMIFVYIILFVLFITCSFRIASIVTYLISTLSALTMYYICMFRGTAFVASDLYSIGAGLNVAGDYNYSPNFGAFIAISICIMGIALSSTFRGEVHAGKKLRLVMICVALAVCGAFYGTYFKLDDTKNMKVKLFKPQDTYVKKGAMLSVVRSFSYLFPEKPDGYSVEAAETIAAKYIDAAEPATSSTEKAPNLIMIMNESLCDVSDIGDSAFSTNTELLPFMKSLRENTWKGTLHEERHGGGTAIMEYEVLSGNTNAFLPVGTIAYQTLIRDKSPSLASQLDSLGYQGIIAGHPHKAENYNRDDAYPLIGFKETRFREEYDAAGNNQPYGRHISDRAAFQELIDEYEAAKAKSDAPFFTFQVTMQNHAPYDSAESRDVKITSKDFQQEDVEQYLNYAQASDEAFHELVSYFEKTNDPTLIVMWGDHAPRFPSSYFKKLMGVSGSFTDEQEMEYNKTPLVMWANYDIENRDLGDLSNNFVGGHIMEMLGQPKTGYQRFLQDFEKDVPEINSIGYMGSDGKFYEINDKESPYYEKIREYRILEYNLLVDTKHTINGFFELSRNGAGESSRTSTADFSVTNTNGFTYDYTLYKQSGAFAEYAEYLREHGCSTCALASVLGAVTEEPDGITPDQVIREILPQVLSGDVLAANFGASLEDQRPLTLSAMTKVFDAYGVAYERPTDNHVTDQSVREVESHLREGNPVVVTFGNGKKFGLTAGVHTVLLMGLDDRDYVCLGDSVWKKKSRWGDMGLIKSGTLTVCDVLSCITGSDWNLCTDKSLTHDFYQSKKDQGYLMIYHK